MTSKWQEIISEVQVMQGEAKRKGSILWYRGQRLSEWTVKSSLHRRIENDLNAAGQSLREIEKIEMLSLIGKTLFHRYKARAWNLLDQQERSDWGIVFSMQHHGIPTRLLDWTESFACAVYFAHDGRKPSDDAAIYVLDAQALNKEFVGEEGIVALDGNETIGRIPTYFYHPGFLSNSKNTNLRTLAVAPILSNPRMRAQRCAFTLSGDSFLPMEIEYEKCVRKIALPADTYEDSLRFLDLVGIGHFGYYPDFEGLRRELIESMDKEVSIAKEVFQSSTS